MTSPTADIPPDWSLECANLTVHRGKRPVVQDVSISLHGGECLSLVGPNGSGKTTLLLAMLGLLPPAGGTVRLSGKDIRQYPARLRGRFAAYIPQIIQRVPAFTVYDVVAGGRYPHLSPLAALKAADHHAIHHALELCALTHLAQRPVNEISGGERQKTIIAAAIAQDPQLLVLDEPNTGLDPAYQIELVRILKTWRKSGRGLLLVSHDLQLPAALGGRVTALRDGRVTASGSVDDVLTVDVLSGVYQAQFGIAITPGGQQIVLPAWW